MDESQPADRIARLEAQLDEARRSRSELEMALRRLGSDMDRLFTRYRSERAWWLMLRIRKAYALLCRDGVRGWRHFFRWAFTGFSGDDLEAYELPVPHLANYWPGNGNAPVPSTAEPARAGAFDVVILPVIDFNYRVGRPQHLAVQLAQKGHRVYWISPTPGPVRADAPPYSIVPIRTNLLEVHLTGEALNLHGGPPPEAVRAALSGALDRLCHEERIQAPCVIVQFPFWRETALALRNSHGGCVVYDCMDDWSHWSTEPRIGAWGLAQEQLLSAECDVLTVSAAALQERYEALGLRPALIRNGVDFDWFTQPQNTSPLQGIASPVIGYYGSIAPWFDVQLMAQVAARRPAWSFVLIGQVHGTDVGALKACPNVHLLGERPYRELPAFLESFDVAVIPFRVNELIRSVDPVKVYEYLSRGKPVVATRMPELRACRNLIAFADTPDAFVTAIEEALADPELGRVERIGFARENTWSKRAEQLETAVAAALSHAGTQVRN